ncbi:hypothetical protein AB0442_31565 [Kitasatospora sp. NPDC085895]
MHPIHALGARSAAHGDAVLAVQDRFDRARSDRSGPGGGGHQDVRP